MKLVLRTGIAGLGLLTAACTTPSRNGATRVAVSPGDERPLAVTSADELEAVVVEYDDTPELSDPAGDPYDIAVLDDAGFAASVSDSRTYYQVAKEAYRHGDIETAREFFDRAVDAMCQAADAGHPQADDVLDSVTGYIAAHEVAFADWEEAIEPETAPFDPSPIESLRIVELPEIATPSLDFHEPHPETVRVHHDFPLVVNNQVRSMLKVYKGRLKDEIQPAFQRSGRWLPMIHEIFREEGVPLDLAWLSLVESGFKPTAYSRARAKGLWQFIRSTGRAYGLDKGYWVDERSDPPKATRAAARHLRDLYEIYDDWYLALAAYNAGPGKVNRAIRRVGKKDFWAIASTRYLRRETRNYVPAMLATLMIAQDPAAHGFDLSPELPWTYDEVDVAGPADLKVLARCAGSTVPELKRLNPELRRRMTPGDQPSYTLRVPLGTAASFQRNYAKLPKSERLQFALHTVRRGETLGRIASRYGVRVDSIVAANGLRSRNRISIGTKLRIPSSGEAASALAREHGRRSESTSRAVHRVRRGETLGRIAKRYGVRVRDLRSWNKLRSDRIQVGQRLEVRAKAKKSPRRSAPSVARSGSDHHVVRRGDTLARLSGRYGVSIAQLKRINGLRGSTIVVGQRLAVSGDAAKSAKAKAVRHRVRRGETLWGIARRYGVSVADLSRWNSTGNTIRAGQRLKVYVE